MPKPSLILISGTSRGIGRDLAERFLLRGDLVFGCSRSPTGIKQEGYTHFNLDITDEMAVKKMFSSIRKSHGQLSALINSAGMQAIGNVLLTSIKTVQDVFATNCNGVFLLSREACKLMGKNKFGRIVNISSIAVPLASPGSAIYSASKAAIEQFASVLAREVALSGITVNNLSLSIVEGDGMADNIPEKQIEETLNQTILKQRINSEDIFHAVQFLLSPKSGKVTNQTLYLGGI